MQLLKLTIHLKMGLIVIRTKTDGSLLVVLYLKRLNEFERGVFLFKYNVTLSVNKVVDTDITEDFLMKMTLLTGRRVSKLLL